MKYLVAGLVLILIVFLMVFRVKKSTMTASPPPPLPPAESNVTPVYSMISAAGKMQTQVDEITKKHILKVQTLTDPAAITSENASYAEQVKKIKAEYEAKIS